MHQYERGGSTWKVCRLCGMAKHRNGWHWYAGRRSRVEPDCENRHDARLQSEWIEQSEDAGVGNKIDWKRRCERIESAAKRVIAAFEAHGESHAFTRESDRTRHECESAMVALDDALKLNLQPNA